MMIKHSLAVALGVAGCGLVAGPAEAANLFMGSDNVMQYVDLSNQDNHVTVSNGRPGGLLVQDTFSLNATPNCTPTPSFSLSATCMPTNGRPLQRYAQRLPRPASGFARVRGNRRPADGGQRVRGRQLRAGGRA